MLSRFWRRIAGRALGTEVVVSGDSMSPTFRDGDRAILFPGSHRRDALERFAVVVVRAPDSDREDIKRVVGLPGELIEIRGGELWVDGVVTQESHMAGRMPSNWLHAWSLQDDEYVVLSDNRAAPGAVDSRRYGPVSRGAIVGPVSSRL